MKSERISPFWVGGYHPFSAKGIIVERGNAKKLSEAMEYLILNPDSAEKMGNSAMEVNTRFHQCTISKMWLDIISKVKQ